MDLKAKLEAGPVTERKLKIERWRDSLDEETREAFDKAAHDPMWSAHALARMLTSSGFAVSQDTVRKYRSERLGVTL